VAVREGVTLTFVYGDHLGSTSLTTNLSGTKVSEVRYYPFGEVRYSSGSLPSDRTFTGQRAENAGAVGSLMDYGARFLSPVLGRFVSADSVVPKPGNPQNLNRYAYTLNNPLKYIDPIGHWINEPGEQYKHNKPLTDEQQKTYQKVQNMISTARWFGYSTAPANLGTWLNGATADVIHNANTIRNVSSVRHGLEGVVNEFNSAIEFGIRTGDIKPGNSSHYWKSGFTFGQIDDPDRWFGMGSVSVRLNAEIEITQIDGGYIVSYKSLKVQIYDVYNWDAKEGKSTFIPIIGIGTVTDAEMASLNQPNGPAKEFNIAFEPWYEDESGLAQSFEVKGR
jgi:RHS repeat-associated protein